MRTTVTLDDDVFARLEALSRTSGKKMRTTINEALRLGLDRAENPGRDTGTGKRRYRIKAEGLRPRVQDLDDIAGVLSIYEREDWR